MQFRLKKTGEIVDLVPGPYKGKMAFQDFNGNFYDWEELEPVRIVTGTESSSVRNLQVRVPVSVSGSIITKT